MSLPKFGAAANFISRTTYTSEMEPASGKIRFFFGHLVVGCFEDEAPLSAGSYRYMQFRGAGHSHLVQELTRKGPQYCHYVADGKSRYFTVMRIPSPYVLEVSEMVPSLVSRILESE